MTRKFLTSTLTALTLGAVALSVASPASAFGKHGGDQGRRGQMMFDQLDANSDGVLTADEFEARMKERFATLDADGNGEISAEELATGQPKRQMADGHKRGFGKGKGFGDRAAPTAEQRQAFAERMIEQKDQNDDGLLSVEELAAAPNGDAMFKGMDTDGDGSISREEFDAARQDRAARMPKNMPLPQN
ncbi:EF-hand domain-containing protein [Actibacterium lipolyticum]|uniref:EF hand n=1 Tax=Actibacterium lipolyticum TaxID=1524263 RepID=A0A238JTR3_9RHOB|nr:EF-hand domain-containing protein [Actibacterium lipolyticum]SMX33136.1 EF hand [Actibacterium lipolyticum]